MVRPAENNENLLDALERRARDSATAEGADSSEPDLLDALRATEAEAEAAGVADTGGDDEGEAPDRTLGGYIARHDRPPAFTGADDQPYTVDIEVEETDDPEAPFVAFFVFVRWAETGAGIMGHVESGDVAAGFTEEQARGAALDLSLYEVKAELDAAIRRRERVMKELED